MGLIFHLRCPASHVQVTVGKQIIYLCADLTKGSFGLETNYNVIYISKPPKIKKKIHAFTMNSNYFYHIILSKSQMFLTKFNDKFQVCCHGNVCACVLPTSFNARYVILKACKETGYVDLCYVLSFCYNIHSCNIHIICFRNIKFS